MSFQTLEHGVGINDYQLKGKSALVTGVSRSAGIGAAIAHAFASMGTNVFTTYFRPYDQSQPWGSIAEEPLRIIDELKAKEVQAQGMEIDLADPDAAALIFDRAEQEIGKIDILVNNATCDYTCNIESLTAPLLDHHYAVNIRGTTLLCAEFSKRHDGRDGGRIINLTSGQALAPMPENLPYAMTKNAIEALTTCLSVSLASKQITVNAVDPGACDTGWMSPEIQESITRATPLGRLGMPQDAMRTILFLSSAQAQWITGQVIRSRGGL